MRTWRDPEAFVRETGYRDPEVDQLILNRISRRALLRSTAVGGGLAAFLAACGGDSGGGSSGSSGGAPIAAQPRQQEGTQPKRGGQVIVAQISPHDDIDPHVTLTASFHAVAFNLCNTLVYVDNDFNFLPGLAESWTIEDEAKTYLFKLRQDVKFHDGTPFNAQAMAFNYDRMVDPATKSRGAKSYLGTYDRAEAVDDYTLRVRFKEPYPAFLIRSTRGYLVPISPKAVQEGGNDGVNRRPIATGPYKMAKDWNGPGTEIELVRNEDYRWAPSLYKNQGPAWFDRITYREIRELTTRLSALESGELDVIHEPGEPNIERLNRDDRFLVVQDQRNGSSQGYHLNIEAGPASDIAVRKAMLYQVDRESMLKAAYFGVHPPAYGPFSPALYGYDPSVESMYPRDSKKAEQLLEDAGWKKGSDGIRAKGGQRLKLIDTFQNTPTQYPPLHEFLQAQMKPIGIEIELRVLDQQAVTVAGQRREGDMFALGIRNNDPDVMRTVYHSESYGVRFIPGKDPKVDQLLDRGAALPNGEERVQVYKEFQKYVMEQAYSLPILAPKTTYAATAKIKNMPGIDSNGEYLWAFMDAYKE